MLSLRVCEVVLNTLELLIEMDVVHSDKMKQSSATISAAEKEKAAASGSPALWSKNKTQKKDEVSKENLYLDSIVRLESRQKVTSWVQFT